MSDKESWINSFTYMADKTVNPVRACATYEQIEAQNKKNELRYGWAAKENNPDIDKYENLRVKYKGKSV